MQRLPAYIWDLEGTLFNTDGVSQLAWHTNSSRLDWRNSSAPPYGAKKVRAYDVMTKLQKDGHPTGIVTSLPESDARPILEERGLSPDALVCSAASDREVPLYNVLCALGANPGRAVFVGSKNEHSVAAKRLGVLSVGAGWVDSRWHSYHSNAPDIWFRYPHQLKRRAEDASALITSGYMAELVARGLEPKIHQGSVIRRYEDSLNVFALGRYFGRDDNQHHYNSQLSLDILDLKQRLDKKYLFARSLSIFLHKGLREKDYAIVNVPAKEGQIDRLAAVLQEVRMPEGMSVIPKALKCVKEVPNYKRLGRRDRRDAITNSIQASRLVAGRKVLVIDDVVTSGETARECARALKRSGALKVNVVAFAQTQFRIGNPSYSMSTVPF